MNNYEIVYIIHPALQEGRLSDIKNKIHDKIASFKGKVLYDDNWGKKKLAYAIDKQKYGTYLFCQFLLEGKDVKEINTDCELNSNILRHLITRIESCDILDEKNKKESKKKSSDKESKKELLENEQNDDNSSKEDIVEKKVTEVAAEKEGVVEDVKEKVEAKKDVEEELEEKVIEKDIEEKDNSEDSSEEK
ncbi:MAG: 30S ribosomal protein S6 [Candidatus Marinimicrobia bacterium]|nr:30S ribosomal protein S6 [Candidatus Neomarinimicrobiota bacterium]